MKIGIQFQSEIKHPLQFVLSICNGDDLVGVQYTGIMYEGDSIEYVLSDLKLIKVKPV